MKCTDHFYGGKKKPLSFGQFGFTPSINYHIWFATTYPLPTFGDFFF